MNRIDSSLGGILHNSGRELYNIMIESLELNKNYVKNEKKIIKITNNPEYINTLIKAIGYREYIKTINHGEYLFRTIGHQERVKVGCGYIIQKLEIPEEDKLIHRLILDFCTTHHDISKIFWPKKYFSNHKFQKKDKEVKEGHPEASKRLIEMYIKKVPEPYNNLILEIILHHHERWDGKGYPDGLKEKDIPLGARIMAVADSSDAMGSDKRYHKDKKNNEGVIEELKKGSGTMFDPKIVDIFLSIIE
ncbi:MAG: HD domain-containing protein [Nanoarchaeota archaeon]|nr:HD domain-containing protein [Nanoarchaeota archaeon]